MQQLQLTESNYAVAHIAEAAHEKRTKTPPPTFFVTVE
jgi:hypothetical protein